MPKTQELIKILSIAKRENRMLSRDETIKVLEHIYLLSENKKVIKKIMALFIFLDTNKTIKCLSSRETQIFNLIGCDCTSSDVAEILNISKDTVSTHRKNIIKKMNLSGTKKLKYTAQKYIQEL